MRQNAFEVWSSKPMIRTDQNRGVEKRMTEHGRHGNQKGIFGAEKKNYHWIPQPLTVSRELHHIFIGVDSGQLPHPSKVFSMPLIFPIFLCSNSKSSLEWQTTTSHRFISYSRPAVGYRSLNMDALCFPKPLPPRPRPPSKEHPGQGLKGLLPRFEGFSSLPTFVKAFLPLLSFTKYTSRASQWATSPLDFRVWALGLVCAYPSPSMIGPRARVSKEDTWLKGRWVPIEAP